MLVAAAAAAAGFSNIKSYLRDAFNCFSLIDLKIRLVNRKPHSGGGGFSSGGNGST